MLHEILIIARKEFRFFFASPSAYILLGGFLVVILFTFFWVESFFTRNIVDLRPMFSWMPIITIFLAGALTMRSWSEERRSGTLETLMSGPTHPFSLVFGKFLAVEALVALALLLTLPLVITVAFLGELDWGPVIGGYIATLFLAASYLSIGLFISAQSDNSVISLIITVLIASIFYIVGSTHFTEIVNRETADILTAIGAGARFNSITRGILDLRDIYYYLSIVGTFLTLNVFQLRRLRRAGNPCNTEHKFASITTGLIVANFLVGNFWIAFIMQARSDLTASHRYTLSSTTINTLNQLKEPLLIRGYFSSQTHPFLAPLIPQIRDIMTEYALVSNDHVRVEFVNPTNNASAEKSAAEVGIRPTPFQTASRYKSSVVSSYFDILISYGDENEVLDFRDLIDVKSNGAEQFEVGLANPEYTLTSAVKKVMQSYVSGGDPFSMIPGGITLHGYLSSTDRMPKNLIPIRQALLATLTKLKSKHNVSFTIEDPDTDDGILSRQLTETYGIVPQVASLLDPAPFWFSLRVQGNGRDIPVLLPESGSLDEDVFLDVIQKAVKRLAPGFLRTVALVTPIPPTLSKASIAITPGPRYSQLRKTIGESMNIIDVDLSTGHVLDDVDVLMVLAPKHLEEKELFAIDQFLMRGGSVVVATSDYRINMTNALSVSTETSGLETWLESYGIKIGSSLVLDSHSAVLPIPVERTVNGYVFKEIIMIPYPYFSDIRATGLSQNHPITASLGQLTVNWASPIEIDTSKAPGIEIKRLINSSQQSWLSSEVNVTPDYEFYPDTGFSIGEQHKSHVISVAAIGRFNSAFANKDSPLLETEIEDEMEKDEQKMIETTTESVFRGKLTLSPNNAKLVVVSSSNFASDMMLSLASRGSGSHYTKPINFLQNAIDWTIEDPSLTALRGKVQFARMLKPISTAKQTAVEYMNYGFVVLGLFIIWGWRRSVTSRDHARNIRILNEVKP